ncbi:MAG: tetratricopeptide repeat protein [Pseudomonadota bacterium]
MKIRFFKLILFSVFCVVSSGFADENQLVITPGMQYEYAQSLVEQKDYETAIVEFKRFVHFFPDSEQKDQAVFFIAWCLYEQKKYHDAAKAFNQIIINSKEDDPLAIQAYFYQSQAFMKLGNTGYAKIVLHNFLKLTDDQDLKDKIYFNLAQIHLADAANAHEGSLALAGKNLMKISEQGQKKYQTDQYLDLVTQADNLPHKEPGVAGLLSIVPGGGFLYCERYKDAFVTFLLNVGLMVAAYEAWDDGNEALAGVIGFVETGFYTGNIYGSISSAHKYNQAQTIKLLNQRFSISPRIDPDKRQVGLSFQYLF